MANIKSQIKRNRQNDKRRLRNRVYRGQTRTAVKDARTAIESGDPDTSKKSLLQAISNLDRAAEKGVIHKNKAARGKSRLMKLFNRMEPAARKEPARVEAEVVETPKAAPKRGAKAAPKAAPKVAPKAEPKKAETKKPAEKKAAAKPAAKKPAEKKTSTPAKKPTAKK